MQELSTEFSRTRELVGSIESRDLRRGFTLTLLLLIAVVWLVSLVPLILIAHRVSRPIQQLTAGLTDFAAGDWDRRLDTGKKDEVGRAVEAFNHMAEQLRHNRDRLVYLAQMSSWQSLARKTAHELKNSLTPIRLTVEEMLARQPTADRAFMEQAAQIVVSEIEALEGRVRAFSEFASEPPVKPEVLDVNALVGERVSLLKPAHAETTYRFTLDEHSPRAYASADLVKSILTNLLENAAEAAGAGGSVLTVTRAEGEHVVDRGTRLRTGSERRRGPHAVRADHHVQEARHGPRALHREKERAGLRRRHFARGRRAGRRRVPGRAAGSAFRCWRRGHEPQASHRDRGRRAEHRFVAAADSGRRRLWRHGLRVGGAIQGGARSRTRRPLPAGRAAA